MAACTCSAKQLELVGCDCRESYITTYCIESASNGWLTQLWAASASEAMYRYNVQLNEAVRECKHQEQGYAWPRIARAGVHAVRMRVLADGLHHVRADVQF